MFWGAVGLLIGLVLLLCCLWTAFLIAYRLTGSEDVSVRWSATAIVAYWLLVAVFYLLSLFAGFRLWSASLVWILLAALTHWRWGRDLTAAALLRQDLARVAELGGALLRTPLRWVLFLVAIVLSMRTIRGLVAPPLAWDALTYHLVKAGQWVQSGGFSSSPAPDAWGYYDHFPPAGDIIWAWAMLPVSGDALLALAGLLVWLTCLLGAYGAARAIGARELPAATCALSLCLTPAVINFLTSAYINNMVLAVFLLGGIFLSRFLKQATLSSAILAAAALSLALGAQLSTAPFFALAAVVLLIGLIRSDLSWRRRGLTLLTCLAVITIALPGYIRAWKETGSPVYPFTISMGGKPVMDGNEELNYILSPPLRKPLPNQKFFALLFYDRYWEGWEHLNFGPAGLAILCFGVLMGLYRVFRQKEHRVFTIYLMACTLLLLAGLMSENMVGQRSMWAPVAARFLTPALGAMAITLAATLPRVGLILFVLTAGVNFTYAVPQGWSLEDIKAITALSLPLLIGLAIAAELLLLLWRKHQKISAVLAALGVLTLSLAIVLPSVREKNRYPLYAAAARGWVKGDPWSRAFDVHGIFRSMTGAWTIWKYFDDERPKRLAVTAGWDGVGHNWYRYPLLGSRLQNELRYVPITLDGTIIDYRLNARIKKEANAEAWIRRLVEQKIEFVVALYPRPIEESWMQARKHQFQLVITGEDGFGHAYRFNSTTGLKAPPP